MDPKKPTTDGELLFEEYLSRMGYDFQFDSPPPGGSKRPDYKVRWNGKNFLFEVKDFDEYLPSGFGAYDPYSRIREKINDAAKQFKEFKEFPCAVILKNNNNAFVHLENPHIVLGSMYGDYGFKVPIDLGDTPSMTTEPPITPAFLGRGKMVMGNQRQNKTISALITLRRVAIGMLRYRKMLKEVPGLGWDRTLEICRERYPQYDQDETHLGVIVWENAIARIPLDRTLFRGDYDVRWGIEGEEQVITFEGKMLQGLL